MFEVTAAVFLDLEVCTNVPVTWLNIKQRVLEKVHNPWGWRTLPYNYMAMHTGMCHWTERGVFASLSSQCHQPVSYMHTGALRDRARQGKMTGKKAKREESEERRVVPTSVEAKFTYKEKVPGNDLGHR